MKSEEIRGWVDGAFRPVVDISLTGLDRPLSAKIDTSYRSILCIRRADALAAGLELSETRRQKVSRSEHPSGSLMSTFGYVEWFGREIPVPILVADDRYEEVDMLPRLGMDLFTDCILNVNFPTAVVIVSKISDQP